MKNKIDFHLHFELRNLINQSAKHLFLTVASTCEKMFTSSQQEETKGAEELEEQGREFQTTDLETVIDDVALVVPASGWYSGKTGALGIFIRIEAQLVEPFFLDIYLYSSKQSAQPDTCIRHLRFDLRLEGEPKKKVFRLHFEKKLVETFEGTAVHSIEGTFNTLENIICLEIGVKWGWFSWTMKPSMVSVEEPVGYC